MTSLPKLEGLGKSFAGVVALRGAPSKFEASAVDAMAKRREISSRFVVNASRKAKPTREARQRVQNRADRNVDPVNGLRSGAHPKVVLTKWFPCNPRVLLLDELTRGVCATDRLRYEGPASAERREK